MTRLEDDYPADVHPDEVRHMQLHGWIIAGEQIAAPVDVSPVVGKGPRGKWYVKIGKAFVKGPFETEDEAKAALE